MLTLNLVGVKNFTSLLNCFIIEKLRYADGNKIVDVTHADLI